jgi:hypothetical protein
MLPAGSSGLSMTLLESWGHVIIPLASCHQQQDGRQPSNTVSSSCVHGLERQGAVRKKEETSQ